MQKIKFIVLALIFSICSSMARPMDSSFFKTWEEKELNLECDSGDGKYSACTKLVEILSKKCIAEITKAADRSARCFWLQWVDIKIPFQH